MCGGDGKNGHTCAMPTQAVKLLSADGLVKVPFVESTRRCAHRTFIFLIWSLAQLGEHLPYKAEGSAVPNPSPPP